MNNFIFLIPISDVQKIYFSLVCNFKLLLIAFDWAQKLAYQITFWGFVAYKPATYTAQKITFSITDFFSKCTVNSHLLKKSVLENFVFCPVLYKKNKCNFNQIGERKSFLFLYAPKYEFKNFSILNLKPSYKSDFWQ